MTHLTWNSIEFEDKFNIQSPENQGLLLNKCPSVIEAFNKFTKDISIISSFDAIIVKIDGELNPLSIEQQNKFNSILSQQEKLSFVSLTSTVNKISWIYWKLPVWQKIFGLYEFIDVYENEKDEETPQKGFIHNFLLTSIHEKHPGLMTYTKLDQMKKNVQNIRLDFLGKFTKNEKDSTEKFRDENLLMIALNWNGPSYTNHKLKIIEHLIDLNIDVTYEADDEPVTSFSQDPNILLALLKAGATYPNEFNDFFKTLDNNLENKNLIKFCEDADDIHSIVGKKKKNKDKRSKEQFEDELIQNLKLQLGSFMRSPNFYNFDNKSAPYAALKAENFKIYDFLIQNQISLGKYEIIKESNEIKEYLAESHSKVTKSWYLTVLVGNSSVGHDLKDKNFEKWKYIKEAFIALDEIPEIQPLLMLVAASKYFEIVFEFNRDSVHHLDPRSNSDTKGVLRSKGFKRIYISAKEFLDSNPKDKFKAIGTLAHELCHFALLLLNRNFFKPYVVNDKSSEEYFEQILQAIKNNVEISEPIMKLTFDYEPEEYHKELIVRIPHILAAFSHEDNKQELNMLLGQLKDLYDFYKSLLPKISKAVKAITKMVKDPKGIKYEDLTDELKAKIRESNINFQGEIVNFGELIKEVKNERDADCIFQLLSSDQIMVLLNDEEVIDVSHKVKYESAEYIERVIEVDDDSSDNVNLNRPDKKKELTYIELINESLVMLCDDPGFGKSTTFKFVASKFKGIKKFKWISYIDLKNATKILKNIGKDSNLNDDEVQKIIMAMLNLDLKTNLEGEIFKCCWESNNMILFIDSFDEILSDLSYIAISLLHRLHSEGKVQLWAAFRRDCIHKTCNKFGRKYFYSIKPFDNESRKKFLKLKLAKHVTKSNTQPILLSKIENFILSVGKCIFIHDRSVKNLLMMCYIVDIFVEDENANTTTTNYFMLIQKIFSKIIIKKGIDDATINLLEAHQVFALKTNFQMVITDCVDRTTQDLNDLEIFRKAKNISPFNYTQYGVIYALSEANCFFVHVTFMEYLVARYLVDNIYNSDGSDNEIKLRINLLYQVGCSSSELCKIHCKFILDYLQFKVTNNERIFLTESFKRIILTYFKSSLYKCFAAVDFLSKFFSFDKEFFKIFWKIDENESFFPWYARVHPHEWFHFKSQLIELIETVTVGEEMIKAKYGKNQKGEILYRIWKQKTIYLYNKTGEMPIPYWTEPDDIKNDILEALHPENTYRSYVNALIESMSLNIDENIINRIMSPISFYDFYKTIEQLLTEGEKREMFLRHGFYILPKFLKNKEHLLELWDVVLNLLGEQSFEKNIIKLGENRSKGIIDLLIVGVSAEEFAQCHDFYSAFFEKVQSFMS